MGRRSKSPRLPKENDPLPRHRQRGTGQNLRTSGASHLPSRTPRPCCMSSRGSKYTTDTSHTPLYAAGGDYMKETCLWHPFGRFHIECGRKCHHFPHRDNGQTRHPWSIGGRGANKLPGPMEVVHRNRIPARLLRHLIRMEGKKKTRKNVVPGPMLWVPDKPGRGRSSRM